VSLRLRVAAPAYGQIGNSLWSRSRSPRVDYVLWSRRGSSMWEFLSCELPQSGNHLRDTLAINSGSYERLYSDTPRASMASASVTVMSRELSGSPPLIARLSRVYSSVRASIRNVVGQFTYEVIVPHMIGSLQPQAHARTVAQPQPSLRFLSGRNFPRTNYPAASATFSKARDVGQKFLR
jgi:hypothetical protein